MPQDAKTDVSMTSLTVDIVAIDIILNRDIGGSDLDEVGTSP